MAETERQHKHGRDLRFLVRAERISMLHLNVFVLFAIILVIIRCFIIHGISHFTLPELIYLSFGFHLTQT